MCDTLTTKLIGQSFNKTSSFDNIITNNSIRECYQKRGISELDNGPKTPNTNNNNSSNSDNNKIIKLDFTKEEDRLKSFENWTNTQVSPDKLSKAGFYFLNHGDVVRCAFCCVEGHCWMPEDNPMEDHKAWMPQCPFVQQNSCNNQHDHSQTTNGRDTFGNYEVFPNSLPEDETIEELQSLALQWTRKAFNSEYKTEESRFNSYKKWPIALKQKPELMARAGFYYLGTGDEVVCYYCGVGLKNWEENDDPWEQHARWYPNCNYLLLEKGREFVEKIRKEVNNPQQQPPQEQQQQQQQQLSHDPSIVVTTPVVLSNDASANSTITTNTSNTNITNNASNLQTKETTQDSLTKGGEWEKGLCKICYKNDVRLVFRPCEHALACVECGLAVEKCPICRKPVVRVDRMLLS